VQESAYPDEGRTTMKAPRSRLAEGGAGATTKDRRPVTVALASAKGGTGKTTLTIALAVQAVTEEARVALVDWEPQGSLSLWWRMRGKPDNPRLIEGVEDHRRSGPWPWW
jgi:Mrp family chromosome partitioning ATPase